MKLARYEDENGRSAGTWLIKELPGLYVEQTPEGWRLCCYAPVGSKPFKSDPEGHAPGPKIAPTPRPPGDNPSLLEVQEAHGARGTLRGTWGQGFKPETELYLSLPEQLQRDKTFKTRAALIMALEAHLQGSRSVVEEIIGG